MKTITAQWFECKIRYDKVMEDGLEKQVTESFVVNAVSFAEAEAVILKEAGNLISTRIEVVDVKKATYKEIFVLSDCDEPIADNRLFKAKLDFITIDENTEKEKRSRVCYLVQADSLKGALKGIDQVMGSTMIDYDAAAIAATKLSDVFYTPTQTPQEDGKMKAAGE